MRKALAALAVLLISILLGWASCSRLTSAPVRQDSPPSMARIALEGEPAGTLTVTRIGHASVLLEAGAVKVLTDPWFTEKIGYHPGEPLAMGAESLPRLTALLSSHGHYDHFDLTGLAGYPHKDVPFVVRVGTAQEAREQGFGRVIELDHSGSAELEGLRVTAVPALHGVPENAYVLELGGFVVFFSGDSLPLPAHAEVKKQFGRVDLALLAVNGLSVFGSPKVMNPTEAAETCAVLGARVAVPTHYRFVGSWFTDTFILDHDGTAEQFQAAAAARCLAEVRILETGQPLILERAAVTPGDGP